MLAQTASRILQKAMASMLSGIEAPFPPRVIEAQFDDIDAMAASPIAWNQDYEQIGRGRFSGQLTQLVLAQVQLGRVRWSPGILQRGAAPQDTWVFGLPLTA